jgi:hypothetical protein
MSFERFSRGSAAGVRALYAATRCEILWDFVTDEPKPHLGAPDNSRWERAVTPSAELLAAMARLDAWGRRVK